MKRERIFLWHVAHRTCVLRAHRLHRVRWAFHCLFLKPQRTPMPKKKKSSDAVFVSLPGSTHLSPDHPKMRQIFGTYFRSSALPSFVTVARKPTTPIEQEMKDSSESYTDEEEMPLEEFLARGATPFEDRRKETF